ncbi:MAG: hypothetical protein HFG34_01200 [Eubacterium sp.]|nr:hypothetical protein [Eubacterium sp.]
MKRLCSMTVVLVLLGNIFLCQGAVMEAKTRPVLNKKNATLPVGEKLQLKLKNNAKKIRWTSSNKKTAKVSSRGLVTARAKGSARITAKAGGKKYLCHIKVVAKTKSSYAEKVLKLVNKERAKVGRKALKLDTSLNRAAKVRAKEITKVFSHDRPDGSSCFSIMKEMGISYRAVGENIAAGQPTPEEVVNSWMNSEGHRANILSQDFEKLGVGYVKTGGVYKHYWVQLFSA